MIPIRDNIPPRTFPFVNYTMIALCSIVFLFQLLEGDGSSMVERYGMIPARVVHPDQKIEIIQQQLIQTPYGIQRQTITKVAEPSAVAPWLTLLTCVFLHGGWMHILGNLWVLHIFGDNVEDRLGHLGYTIFYLFCGVAASATHLMLGPESTIPTIGASGAIAGVMGAYFLLYPNAKVLSALPIFFYLHMMVLPAPIFLGLWFILQFYQGTFSGGTGGGVAWWAHVGGFVAGVAIAGVLKATHVAAPPVEERRLA
jgi:membrane associated rhomboid family serine protease